MQTLEMINVGQAPNDGTGEPHRDAFEKINRNMTVLKAALEDAFKTVEIPASANLNAYTTTGTFHQSANAGAVGGTNYPEGTAGLLQVVAAGTPFVYQRYVTTARRSYWRTRVGSVWTDWVRMLDASILGAPNGVASLGVDSKIPREQLPVMTALAIVAGTDANTVTDPGSYYINSDADATLANNWPIQRAGTLVVERAGSGNVQVTQTYTARSGSGGVTRTFKRVRFSTTLVWDGWQEQARYADVTKSIELTSGADVNTLVTPNVNFVWSAGGVVSGGANWPSVAAAAGALRVDVLNPTNIVQSLTLRPASDRRPVMFQRAMTAGAWGGWYVVSPISTTADLPAANHGNVYVDGLGWHKWNYAAGGYLRASFADDIPDGVNLNTYDVPGSYACHVSAYATPANNYPVQLAGILTVEAAAPFPASNLQVTQTYTAFPETNPVTFKRLRFGASKVWGPWLEQARLKDAMHRVALGTPGVNANTLTADNTFYTWDSGSVITGAGGANWPPVQNGTVGAGFLEVFNLASGLVAQRCTLLGNGQKPRVFQRFLAGSSWESWRVTSVLSAVAFLPVADCGDVYVDAVGWYRWNGSVYVAQTLVSGQLQLMPGATLNGSFTGGYEEGVSTVLQSNSGPTYVTAAPGSGGAYAGFLARGWKAQNTQFVLLGINQSTGLGQILFSRHGTAGIPGHFTFDSSTGECGRVAEDGRWQFGRFVMPNVQTKLHVNYAGGGSEYGQVFRPQQNVAGVAIQFQNINGAVCGFIQNNADALSVYYSTTSDYRSKDVLSEADPSVSLAKINALRLVWYRMKGAPADSAPQLGGVAHEWQQHIGQAVTGEKDEMMEMLGKTVPKYQGVDFSKVVPDLVGAVQHLTQMLEGANARIAQLEGTGSSASPE